MLVLTTLPHRKPKTLVHRRTNGNLTVEIVGHPEFGLPYGVYPRLILLYVCRQVVRTGSPTIDVGRGLTEAMKRFGFAVTGGRKGTITTLRRQLDSLFHASVGWTWRGPDVLKEEHCFIFRGRDTWTARLELVEPYRPSCRITVDPMFLDELKKHPVPSNMSVVRALAALHGPFAIDLYIWLPYRLCRLTVPTDVTWEQLQRQFGAEHGTVNNFRIAFLEALKIVEGYYPQCKVTRRRGGLTLWPSPSTIAPREGGYGG